MIVLVGGIKGGTGKSTIATNLAVYRSSFGFKTLLVDADEQRSASDWAVQRCEYFKEQYCDNEVTTISLNGKYLYREVNKMTADYDDIIIDAGGRDTTSQRSALMIADRYIVPFKPRSFDVWTLYVVRDLFEEARELNPKLKAKVVINQADARGPDNALAHQILCEVSCFNGNLMFLGNRKSFGNAAAEGLSVCEKGNDTKAQDEMLNLYESIYE